MDFSPRSLRSSSSLSLFVRALRGAGGAQSRSQSNKCCHTFPSYRSPLPRAGAAASSARCTTPRKDHLERDWGHQNCGLVSESEASRAGLSAERSASEEPCLPNTRGKGREDTYRQLMLLVRQTCQALPDWRSQATSSDKASGCYQNFSSGLVFPGPFWQEKVVIESAPLRIHFHA